MSKVDFSGEYGNQGAQSERRSVDEWWTDFLELGRRDPSMEEEEQREFSLYRIWSVIGQTGIDG
jgi:hypothetical protein